MDAARTHIRETGMARRLRKLWHVGSYPSIWVLDNRRVIRFKGVRGKELDDAVAKLVSEAEMERRAGK
jgi:hypothetical protein